MLSIRVVSTLEEFASLSDQWDRLLTSTPANNIFLTWEWLYTWTRNYLGKNKLFVLLAYEGNQIVGIAPLYIRKTRYYRILNLRQMEFLGTGEVCSSYLDFIVQEKKRKQVIREVYDYLYREARGLWDVLDLAEVPVESSSIDILYEMVQEEGKVIEIVNHTCCPVIKLTGNVEDFLRGISRNERHNLHRNSKRFKELGHFEYHRVSLNSEVQKEMDTFVGLHEKRWEQTNSGGCFKNPRFLGFHKELVEVFGKKGWVYLDFLVLNSEKVAGIYGYSYNGRCYFYLPGMDPTILPQGSPGRLLLFHCLCQAIREGCRELDLLRGTADYKMAWANGLRRSMTLRLYNRSIRAALSKFLDHGEKAVKILVR